MSSSVPVSIRPCTQARRIESIRCFACRRSTFLASSTPSALSRTRPSTAVVRIITSSVTVEMSCDSLAFSAGILVVMTRFSAVVVVGSRSSESRYTSDQRSK